MKLSLSALLAATCLVIAAPAQAVTVNVSFTFNAPSFAKPELDPLENLLATNGITQVTGALSYDTADALSVTTNFTFSSNIDSLFSVVPTEIVFLPNGTLNQIRGWEAQIGGVDYLLELTGLAPGDVHPNRWFGGKIEGFPNNVFGLTIANGPLTTQVVPVPASLPLMLGGLAGLLAFRRRRAA